MRGVISLLPPYTSTGTVRSALLAVAQHVRSVEGFTHFEVPLYRLSLCFLLSPFIHYFFSFVPFLISFLLLRHSHSFCLSLYSVTHFFPFLCARVKFLLCRSSQFCVLGTQSWHFSRTLLYSNHQHCRVHLIMPEEVCLRCCSHTEATACHPINTQRFRPARKFHSSNEPCKVSYVHILFNLLAPELFF